MSPSSEKPEPAGFGNCGECAYFQTGSTSICYECARARIESLAEFRCKICDQVTGSDLVCGNPLCGRDVDDRGFTYIYAVAMKTGVLDRAIKDYKYKSRWGWGLIFGRVVIGYLNANSDVFRQFDLIIPSPTYIDVGDNKPDHTADVLRRAQIEDESWPFRFDIMSRVLATDHLAGVRRFGDRAALAETQIRDALRVNKPRAVARKAVLVYDDVFTDGLTMREVAYKLKAANARLVVGLVLARQPFKG